VCSSDLVMTSVRRGTRRTLVTTLEALLRALHPLMPFITEEIWQRVRPLTAPDSIMVARYPAATDFAADAEAESEVAWMKQFILAVRQIRGEMDIAPSRRIPLLLQNASPQDAALAARHGAYLTRLAGLDSIRPLAPDENAPESATAIFGELTLLVPMAGLIDPKAEIDRLAKRIAKIDADIAKLGAKLGNENFVRNAPPEVVATDRARVAEFEAQKSGLASQLARVRRMGGG